MAQLQIAVLRTGVLRLALLVLMLGCSGEPSKHVTETPRPTGPQIDEAPHLISPDAISAEDQVGGMSNDAMPQVAAPADAAGKASVRPILAVMRGLPGIDVVESVNQASHVHGGEAAAIDHAQINFQVKDTKPHALEVTKLEMLRGHCRETTWSSRDALVVTGYAVYDWENTDPLAKFAAFAKVRLPNTPDLYSVAVTFDSLSVYQACDRFAFAVKMVVDGKALEIEVPLQVKRYEPLHAP
jgi:hypothetical protein